MAKGPVTTIEGNQLKTLIKPADFFNNILIGVKAFDMVTEITKTNDQFNVAGIPIKVVNEMPPNLILLMDGDKIVGTLKIKEGGEK